MRRLLLAIVILVGCTDVRLWRPGTLERVSVDLERPTPTEPQQEWGLVPKTGERVRYRIGDTFCTQESIEITVPFKVLVIIDYSGSMDNSDPQSLRIDAVEALVTAYAADPSVFFGFLRFGGTNFPLPDLGKDFTNNQGRIQAAMAQLRADNTVQDGQTNYQSALEWAWEAIDDDMKRPDQIPGTRYGILFVTDGRPNVPEDGGADEALARNRPKVRDRITGCDGWKAHQPLNTMIEWLNTYFINVQNADPLAAQLLSDMAQGNSNEPCGIDNWGHGTYQEVADAGDLTFDLDLPTLRKVFVNRSGFVFMNYHLRSAYQDGEMVMARDSDGDGLPDFIESARPDPSDPWATSMYSSDTDRDGISDLVGWSLGMQTNKATPQTIYERPTADETLRMAGMLTQLGRIGTHELDKDGDGLTDAEEDFVGTDERMVDTDRDGISDSVELRFLLNPLDPTDAALDQDGDGFDNKAEIETGMDPHHQEPAWFREAYAYEIHRGSEWQVEIPQAEGPPRIRTCYDFLVSNILFRKPQLQNGTQGDFNLFELSFIDQTRVPIGDTEFVARRETMIARPTDDRPAFYFKREYPEHW